VSPRPAARSMGSPPNPTPPKGLARAAAADDAINAASTDAAAGFGGPASGGAGAGATATEIVANEQSNLDYIALAAMGVMLAGPAHLNPKP
jgi:hypothetical protein